jgi:hypothetical protein
MAPFLRPVRGVDHKMAFALGLRSSGFLQCLTG